MAKVEEHAFTNCYNLKKMVVNNPATSFGADVFENDMDVVLHAPAGSAAESYCKARGLKFEAMKEESLSADESSAKPENDTSVEESQSKEETPTVTAKPTDIEPPKPAKKTNPLFYVFMLTAVLSLIGIIVIRRKLNEYEE